MARKPGEVFRQTLDEDFTLKKRVIAALWAAAVSAVTIFVIFYFLLGVRSGFGFFMLLGAIMATSVAAYTSRIWAACLYGIGAAIHLLFVLLGALFAAILSALSGGF